MKEFYEKLILDFENGKGKFTEKQVNPVKYIDLYAGQEQNEENFQLFAQPAILLDWDINYAAETPNANITVYACYEQLRDKSNISRNRAEALKFFDFLDVVYEVLSQIQTENTGMPKLVSEGFHKADSIVDVYTFTFQCAYSGRGKTAKRKYRAGGYDNLDLEGNLANRFENLF